MVMYACLNYTSEDLMNHTRRKLLLGGSALSIAALAGCLRPGSLSDSEEQSATPNPDADSATEPNDATTDQEDENEGENEDADSGDTQRAIATREVVDFLDWSKNEYARSRSSYRSAVNQVENITLELIEATENGEEVSESEIDLLIETARRYETIGDDEFGEFYSSHLNYRGVINSFEDELRRNQRRGEVELLNESLSQFRRYYGNRRTREIIDTRYPIEPVIGGPIERFISDTDGSMYIFEVMYRDNAGIQTQMVHEDPESFRRYDNVRIRQSPFDYTAAETDLEYTNLFSSGDFRTSEAIIRIHREHDLGGEPIDLRAESVDSAIVYVQKYESTTAAEMAYQELQGQLVSEGEDERWGSSWEKMLVPNGSDNVYAHLANDSEYVIAVDLSTTPWENRPQTVDSENWDSVVASTWIQTED